MSEHTCNDLGVGRKEVGLPDHIYDHTMRHVDAAIHRRSQSGARRGFGGKGGGFWGGGCGTRSFCRGSTAAWPMCDAGLVQEEIEKYRVENTSTESQRQQALAELQGRLIETQEQAAWYSHKHQAAVKRVDQLKVCPLPPPPPPAPPPPPSPAVLTPPKGIQCVEAH